MKYLKLIIRWIFFIPAWLMLLRDNGRILVAIMKGKEAIDSFRRLGDNSKFTDVQKIKLMIQITSEYKGGKVIALNKWAKAWLSLNWDQYDQEQAVVVDMYDELVNY